MLTLNKLYRMAAVSTAKSELHKRRRQSAYDFGKTFTIVAAFIVAMIESGVTDFYSMAAAKNAIFTAMAMGFMWLFHAVHRVYYERKANVQMMAVAKFVKGKSYSVTSGGKRTTVHLDGSRTIENV